MWWQRFNAFTLAVVASLSMAACDPQPPATSEPSTAPRRAASLDADCIADLGSGAFALEGTPVASPDAKLFRSAMSAMRRNDFEAARVDFLKLTDDYPESNYAPHAYFQFGELFLEEGKPALAEDFYLSALNSRPPRNTVFYLALLQLADAQEQQGKHGPAADARKKAASGAVSFPTMRCAREIAAEARRHSARTSPRPLRK